MIIISYDIEDNKLRTKFSKFIKKYGYMLQYSVYEIDNSRRILDNILIEIKSKYEKKFKETDSVLIFDLSNNCKIIRMGYAKHDEDDIIIVE